MVTYIFTFINITGVATGVYGIFLVSVGVANGNSSEQTAVDGHQQTTWLIDDLQT